MPNSKYILRLLSWTGLLLTLNGCDEGLFSPAGPVSESERIILLDSLAVMLAIVIPTIIATLAFAWWFRASNKRARYMPDWSYSGRVELLVWSIPTLVVLFLGIITWVSSHDLDPARPLDNSAKPLDVQVVSLDWKWLFIYPEQGIASVNRLEVPVGRPLHLYITSASVFNVFFVPQLGSQIYAMNGMVADLNLEADKAGVYPGISAQFSGDGFSGMSFDVHAVPQEKFAEWVTEAKSGQLTLDDAAYQELLKQSQNVKPYNYSAVRPGLFDDITVHKLPEGEGSKEGKAND